MIKFVSDIVAGRWFSAATPVSSSNKTDHDITEILLKVALNTKNPNPPNIKIVERGLNRKLKYMTSNLPDLVQALQ
jgi:hypothetical protein